MFRVTCFIIIFIIEHYLIFGKGRSMPKIQVKFMIIDNFLPVG